MKQECKLLKSTSDLLVKYIVTGRLGRVYIVTAVLNSRDGGMESLRFTALILAESSCV